MIMEIISKEVIKPSSSTPNHLKTFKLSFFDQLAMHIYTPILLSYESDDLQTSTDILKRSLSETLTKYYPFAGRLQEDGMTVDCGDQGVVFVDAKIAGCSISDFIQNPKFETQKLLFPEGFLWKESCINFSFLAVQVTSFEGGGMMVTISISHKVADGCTIATFLSDWAATARGEVRQPPMILANSITSLDLEVKVPEVVLGQSKTCVTKRYIFNAEKISELKNYVSGLVENPTKVEVVTAYLFRCAVTASIAKMGSLRKYILIQAVNMRQRMKKPLPENSIGNFTWYYTLSNDIEKQTSLTNLVVEMKKEIKRIGNDGDNLELSDWLMKIKESASSVKELFDDLDVYRCTSLCRRPFYQTDFGWGCPKWVTMADVLVKNVFVLFDRLDGDGIEAMVTLEEEDMIFFQDHQDLLL